MQTKYRYRIDGRGKSSGEIIGEIFEDRGVDIDTFLRPVEDDMIELDKLKNIDKAYNILMDGIATNKTFAIWHDVDLDGISSGTIMYKYLLHYTDRVEVIINEGKEHGVKSYPNRDIKANIIIVVDSFNDYEYYEPMLQDGKQVIILDHHEVKDVDKFDNLDIALVSSANDYPNPELSGAGVVWKFCKYIDEQELDNEADNFADLATCGLIADMCSCLVPENRYICNLGISNPRSLVVKQINGGYPFNAQAVSFGIAPLINAAQRMKQNEIALNAFLSDDTDEVKQLVKQLRNCKVKQGEIVDALMPEITEQAQGQINNKVIAVVIKTDADVSGLLGNKLSSIYQRPVLILKDCGENYFGSGRGYGVEDFMSVVNGTGLARADGHPNAFGVQIRKECIEELLTELNNAYADVEFEIKVEADVLITPDQIDDVLIQNFKACDRISGKGFEPLTIMIQGVDEYIAGEMSKGRHLKLDFGDFLAIKWNFDGDRTPFEENKRIDIVGTLTSGSFGKTFYRQLIIQDWRVSECMTEN